MKNRNKLTTEDTEKMHASLKSDCTVAYQLPTCCSLWILLISLIDSLRSPSGLPRAVFIRSASILSKKSNFNHQPQDTVT